MASSIFGSSNRNPLSLLEQFNQFRASLKDKDPNAMLQQMIQSGQVTQAQVDQARKMAEQFRGLLH